MPNKTLKLQCSEGEIITVDTEVMRKSCLIDNMLRDLEENGYDGDPIPLDNVNGTILNKVIEWCRHHKDTQPLDDGLEDGNEKRSDDIPQWDSEFLRVDQGTLFELIMAANYLDISQLLDLCCKAVANMIKGKSANEIRKTFNIKNDFTQEEEAQVKTENNWAEKE